MLHWGSKEGYQRMKGENIQGIPCDKYNGTLRLDETDLKGEVTIFYWWNCKYIRYPFFINIIVNRTF